MLQVSENYAQTPDGLLLTADGINSMQRWDGVSASMVPAGIIAPTQAPTLAGTGSGSITGAYYGYVRFVDDLGNVSDLSPVSAAANVSNVSGIVYSNVALPTGQTKVKQRQLLRNTAGQNQTYYVEIETTDLTSTSFTGTMSDGTLQAQTAAPLFDTDGNILANTNGVPPSWKRAIAAHLGRMFASAEIDYTDGMVMVTNGSTTVQGIGTNWPANFVGRFLYVTGSVNKYQIDAVNTATQQLTLDTTYNDPTDSFGVYAIRAAPAERRQVYYTYAGKPESWPAFYALQLQEDGDEITGLMPMGSFLYILERQHIYRFTFQSDPGQDGYVFLSSNRGCINNRCWAVVEETAYMLDYSGLHAFSLGSSDPIGAPIQQFFIPYSAPQIVNWNAQDQFHCSHSPAEEVIRWFVCLSGDYLPRHAICLHYRTKRWWIEEFAHPISSSATANYQGHRRIFLGANANKTLLYGGGTLDGPDPSAGTTRGTVTASAAYWLQDALATFPPTGVVGKPVVIVSGTGAGQVGIVSKIVGNTIYFRSPWLVCPDTTSVYQLGGIPWTFQTGWFRYMADEEDIQRRVEVLFQPTTNPASAILQIYEDFASTPLVWHRTFSAVENEGMAQTDGSGDLVIDLTKGNGFAQQRYPGHKELNIDGPRFMQLVLNGTSSQDEQVIYQLAVDGVAEG